MAVVPLADLLQFPCCLSFPVLVAEEVILSSACAEISIETRLKVKNNSRWISGDDKRVCLHAPAVKSWPESVSDVSLLPYVTSSEPKV